MKCDDDDILWCNADMAWTQKGYWKSGKRRKQSDILWRVPRRLSLVMMIVTKIMINLNIYGFRNFVICLTILCLRILGCLLASQEEHFREMWKASNISLCRGEEQGYQILHFISPPKKYGFDMIMLLSKTVSIPKWANQTISSDDDDTFMLTCTEFQISLFPWFIH